MKTEPENIEIDFDTLPSDELIDYISFKEEYPEEAAKAFVVFCNRFQRDILQKAEIYCNKYQYNEVIALEIATCAFARVWKYHSFKKEKAKSKNIDKAILLWLYPIVYNEIIKYWKKNTCSEPDEEDLSIILDIDELVTFTTGKDIEKKRELKKGLEIIDRAMQGLSDKHKIIYLTYKAYESAGYTYIPRKVSKKLREQLDLVQNTIGVYKKEAIDHINKYLEYINGNG